MANQLENDSLTYEKLQGLIDQKLANIEELHAEVEEKEIANSEITRLGCPLCFLSYWQRMKGVILSFFLLNDFFR